MLSTAITLPVGVGAAVYLARFARSQRFVGAVRMALDTLASLPSIVYGLFGFLVFVVQMKAGYSLFAGAFVLALLNLPLVVGIAEESMHAVPRELDEASLALGATPVQTALRVTIPYAWPGILSALVLSVGRVFAESAPLIMTAGTTISRVERVLARSVPWRRDARRSPLVRELGRPRPGPRRRERRHGGGARRAGRTDQPVGLPLRALRWRRGTRTKKATR